MKFAWDSDRTQLEDRIEKLEERLDRIEGKPSPEEVRLRREVEAEKREQNKQIGEFYRKVEIGNS